MSETADLRDKSKNKTIVLLVRRGKGLCRLYRTNYDDHLKIEAEGAFVYGMLRHFTYVAGVFFSFLFLFLLFSLLLSTIFSPTLDSVSTWDWQVDIRTPAK